VAISHVAVGTATSTAGVTSLAVVLPTGWAAGDLLLLWMHWPDAITAPSLPTGWTQQVALTVEGTTSKAALYSSGSRRPATPHRRSPGRRAANRSSTVPRTVA
jgi:hypothetical protein